MKERGGVAPSDGAADGATLGGANSIGRTERRKRRSYEPGHSPKFLVLVDEAVDCEKAIYYASRRAARIGGKVVLLRVIEPIYRNVEWLGVAETLQATARQEAQELLGKYTERASRLVNITPEAVIREGHPAEEIFRLIREDEDVAVLVLAAGSTQLGPGPLVSDLARTAGTYPIPISIVPAHLSYEELDALS